MYAQKQHIIEYYKSRNTSVFVTMLDVNKPFDRVNFWLFFFPQEDLLKQTKNFLTKIYTTIHIKYLRFVLYLQTEKISRPQLYLDTLVILYPSWP